MCNRYALDKDNAVVYTLRGEAVATGTSISAYLYKEVEAKRNWPCELKRAVPHRNLKLNCQSNADTALQPPVRRLRSKRSLRNHRKWPREIAQAS